MREEQVETWVWPEATEADIRADATAWACGLPAALDHGTLAALEAALPAGGAPDRYRPPFGEAPDPWPVVSACSTAVRSAEFNHGEGS